MIKWYRNPMMQADLGGSMGLDTPEPQDTPMPEATPDDAPEPKSFSQEDVDRIVGERIKREREKMQRETKAQVDRARGEAERLAQMTAEQRAQEEAKKRQQELEAREADITRREVRAQAMETLAEKGLPKGLVDTLDCTNADTCQASLEAVEKAFKAAVEAEVNARLRTPEPPKAGTNRQPKEQDLTGTIRSKLFPDKPQ